MFYLFELKLWLENGKVETIEFMAQEARIEASGRSGYKLSYSSGQKEKCKYYTAFKAVLTRHENPFS